jgi:L-ascorbate metabolism protein UlaG (beta-lactamase superfamily)
LILPKGAPDFSGYGFSKISYVKKNDIIEDGKIKITTVSAQHFGGRWAIDNLWDGHPYNGYIISDKNSTVYFAGDTGYNSIDFKELGNKFKIDLALIPFGPYRGKLFGDDLGNAVHVSPLGAIQIFKDINAKKMIPIHHGTFYSNPKVEIEYVKNAINTSGISDKIFLLEQGMKLSFGP